eukprot:6069077-Amphidinium_carterae.1
MACCIFTIAQAFTNRNFQRAHWDSSSTNEPKSYDLNEFISNMAHVLSVWQCMPQTVRVLEACSIQADSQVLFPK